jgi:cbb3-type cytochrome oxidase subunit 3
MIHPILISPLVDFDQGFETEEIINAGIAAFAIILLLITLSTYRKTQLRSLLLVSGAFGLFAVLVVIRQLDSFIDVVGYQTDQIITAVFELMVLLLFFLAIVMKK